MAVNYGDIYKAFGEENPDILYAAMRPQQGSLNFLDWARNLYPKVSTDYLGTQTRTGLAGGTPDWSFANWLKPYPFLRQYQSLSPQQRGENPQSFAPRTRWQV